MAFQILRDKSANRLPFDVTFSEQNFITLHLGNHNSKPTPLSKKNDMEFEAQEEAENCVHNPWGKARVHPKGQASSFNESPILSLRSAKLNNGFCYSGGDGFKSRVVCRGRRLLYINICNLNASILLCW